MILSLAGRVSAFFLATLAVAFVGFSLALFFLVRADLYGRIDERLASALGLPESEAALGGSTA